MGQRTDFTRIGREAQPKLEVQAPPTLDGTGSWAVWPLVVLGMDSEANSVMWSLP